MTTRHAFTQPFRYGVTRALYRTGLSWAQIERALAKWEAGVNVWESVCEEEAKGKGFGLESFCRCSACLDRKCFAYFDQVFKRFGSGGHTPSDYDML